MSSASIGATGLSVNQALMDLVGQNLTNASNPAYHRQEATLAELTFGASTGAGVQISQVQRIISNALDAAVNGNASELSDTNQQLQTLQQVQSYLAPTGDTNTLQSLLESFFNDAQTLSTEPSDTTQRAVVISDAQALTSALNSTASQLTQTSSALLAQGQQLVGQVNQLTGLIAQLNGEIQTANGQKISPNALEDQRDGLISQLAQLVGVTTKPQSDGQTNVFAGGTALVMTDQAVPIGLTTNAQDQLVVTQQGATTPVAVSGGQLGAVLTLSNQDVPQVQSQLDQFTTALVQAFDGVQERGIGLSGPMTSAIGQRAVTSTTVPLAQAGLALPPQAGTLTISVTDQATGQRTTNTVNIDPSTQSLQDVAAAISAVPNLQAVVNNQTGTLTILAQSGYAFDFAGQLSSAPDTESITGTATPAISGSYTGTANDDFTFTVAGSGTVGSGNLSLAVTNSAGTLVNTVNIGQGYTAGTTLQAADGIAVSLSAGTLNAGDSFSVKATANSDTANILTALGINTFFTGSNASDIQVQPGLVSAPSLLGLSADGTPGDGTNLDQLIAVRDQPLLAGGTQTLSQYLTSLVGNVATNINNLTTQQTSQQSVGQSLQAQQQSVSGVDPNEELVKLQQYQQGYQMSAYFISVVNSSLTDLFNAFSSTA